MTATAFVSHELDEFRRAGRGQLELASQRLVQFAQDVSPDDQVVLEQDQFNETGAYSRVASALTC